ncbi:MAG: oligopeptide/dipeptide ABC transporter ATP-binding protein [Pseudomonadota bacterium]
MSLLSLRDVSLAHPRGPRQPPDLEGLSLDIEAGDQLALLGESGSGLSLLASHLLGARDAPPLLRGEVSFDAGEAGRLQPRQLAKLKHGGIAALTTRVGQGFDPARSLGRQIKGQRGDVVERLKSFGVAQAQKTMATRVSGLEPRVLARAALAAALARGPRMLLVDALSTTDPIAMADQMMLLRQQCRASRIALLLLTRQPALAAEMTDRIVILYAGQMVEDAPAREAIRKPRHPYTAALIRSLPERTLPHTPLAELSGEAPLASALPRGCRFHPRCAHALAGCYLEPPGMTAEGNRRFTCNWPLEVGE